jgi:hypothetical protein
MNAQRLLAISILAVFVSGCADNPFAQTKRPPDEFAVFSRAPLSVPPDYGLRPPTPGRHRPQLVNPQDNARSALGVAGAGSGVGWAPAAAAPAAAGSPASTAGTVALLQKTGGLQADPEIRLQIDRETTILAEADQSFTERLMFWRTPTEYGTVVDAAAEARRIQENQALGRPIVDGETPTIARRRRALLEGIFN